MSLEIKFQSPHKSIKQLDPITLPDFTVLTGVNGSGKTHFLEAIKEGSLRVDGIENIAQISLFDHSSFRLPNEGVHGIDQVNSMKRQAWRLFNGEKDTREKVKEFIGQCKANFESRGVAIRDITRGEKSVWLLAPEDFGQPDTYNNFLALYKRPIDNFFSDQRRANNEYQSIHRLIKALEYSADEIDEKTFYELHSVVQLRNNLLPEQLGLAIWEYYLLSSSNELFRGRGSRDALSDEEFEKKHGPKPWHVIKETLSKLRDFEYEPPDVEQKGILEDFQLTLKHKDDASLVINFDDLSSGEKTMMALAASLYRANTTKLFPSVLLLDEVDTALHPSMIDALMEALTDVFLERGMKIILVTHSPTTIALSPEESIFVMNKSGSNRLLKSDRSKALSVLTEGYMTFDEGLKLLDDASGKDLCIFSEGKNVNYIDKASEFFAADIRNRFMTMKGFEGKSGKDDLKKLYEVLSKFRCSTKFLFVWDCDFEHGLIPTGNMHPFSFDKNTENTKVKKGIENLFPVSCFTDDFYPEKPKPDGGTQKSLDKDGFLQHMLQNGTEQEFSNFKPLFDEIRSVLESQSTDSGAQ